MSFITGLFANKRREVVYDSILMIIDRCIKMIKYIFVIKKIVVAKLAKLFFEKIILRFEASTSIVSDRNSIFINAF